MKVFFFASEPSNERERQGVVTLRDVLERSGVQTITKDARVEEVFPDTFRQMEAAGETFLDHVSGIVVEGSRNDSEVGYLLAYSIAQRKPVLLLLEKGKAKRNPMESFGSSTFPKNVTIAYYTDATREATLLAFLRSLGDIEYREAPTIKFTLRITPRIEQFLHFKTHNTKMTKADFLRDVILKDHIESDEQFRQYVTKNKRDD